MNDKPMMQCKTKQKYTELGQDLPTPENCIQIHFATTQVGQQLKLY